jgi:hypothetical protein
VHPQPCRAHASFSHVTRTNVLGTNAVQPHMPPRLGNWYLRGSSSRELHWSDHGTHGRGMYWGVINTKPSYSNTYSVTSIGRYAWSACPQLSESRADKVLSRRSINPGRKSCHALCLCERQARVTTFFRDYGSSPSHSDEGTVPHHHNKTD